MQRQKIREIVIGTNNKGKLREIRDLIPKKVKVLSLKNITAKSPKETSKTFKGNALLKAKYYSKLTGKICLADDSGLEIDLLNKAPGIYSARWSGKKNNFNSAIKKVTEEKEGETTYRLKGDISGGTISIRTTGRSSLKVEIKYNLN